jgi:hypothetical protein
MGTGFDYSSGKYGNAKATDMLYIPVIAKYETDDLTLKLTVPYISITGPGGVIRGMGRKGKATTLKTRTVNSGLGDITASAGYNVYSDDSWTFDLYGNVKLGTASATKGLGTGMNDYSAQVDGYYTLKGTTFFSTAGYKVIGVPTGVTLNNAPYATFGISQKLSKETSAGVMLDVAKSSSALSSGTREMTVYLSQKITPDLKLMLNVLRGFSNGSPDFGFGGMLTGYF